MATDDDSDVPESGGVFTFGKSKFADNVPSKFWVRNDPVAAVACGDEHTALVAESGRIFTFGSNDWGQLGLGDSKARTKPSCIKSLKSEKIRSVACGRSTTYVATESGKVFSCGSNSEGQLGQGVQDVSILKPAQVQGLPSVKVKMLSAGADHAALLTESGELYLWGGGSEGQLGMGTLEECPEPKLLEVDEKVTCVSCGYYHTAFTTESGALYTFGESENGKLGLGENPGNTNVPQKVEGISSRVRTVACGGSHTVAITIEGRVFTFGDSSNGQLGHGNIQLEADTPHELISLRDTKIHMAACGENHTSLISHKGVLFSFGDGRHGKLGLGEENFANQFKPSAVTRFGAFTVENVACGGCHMLVLARPKLQNGQISVSDSEEQDEEQLKPVGESKQLELLRASNDLDLSGSFSARNRRREKQDPSVSMSRTLPPLNSSMGGRSLPPLGSTIANCEDNPLNKSMLPPLKKPGESSSEDRQREESTESEENKGPIKKESHSTLHAAPVPAPRLTPRISPQPSPRLRRLEKEAAQYGIIQTSPSVEDEGQSPLSRGSASGQISPCEVEIVLNLQQELKKQEGDTDDSESDTKKDAVKPASESVAKASPVPQPRFGVKVKPAKSDTEEESGSEEKKEDTKTEKPSFRKQQTESEDEKQDDKKEAEKKKELDKKNRNRAKKRGGLFGKKSYLDSDEDDKEDSESESEASSEADKGKKTKRSIFSRDPKKKGKARQNRIADKGDKKQKALELEDESKEAKDKTKEENKKAQSKSDEEESSNKEDQEKTEKETDDSKPLEKKKSKLCVIL